MSGHTGHVYFTGSLLHSERLDRFSGKSGTVPTTDISGDTGVSMRIGILTQYFPPEMGAPQARLYELAVRLRARGHSLTVLTAMPKLPDGPHLRPVPRPLLLRRGDGWSAGDPHGALSFQVQELLAASGQLFILRRDGPVLRELVDGPAGCVDRGESAPVSWAGRLADIENHAITHDLQLFGHLGR